MTSTRRTTPRSAVAMLAAAAVLIGLAAGAESATARPMTTGITNLGSDAPLAFERTRAAGARMVRIPLPWGAVAPASTPAGFSAADQADPRYEWSAIDAAVGGAVGAGLVPILQIDGAPRWAQRCASPDTLPGAVCDPDPEALRVFAAAAASRYSGALPGIPRVRHWQALNEPNLSIYFFPQFDTAMRPLSPGLYRRLLNAFYAGVKSVNRANLVIAAGLGPIERRPWTIGPMRFTRDLLCMRSNRKPRPGNCEGGVRFDIFAIQPYTTGGPTHKGKANDVQIGDLGKLRALLRAAESAKRIKGAKRRVPLWITEFSWDSKPPDPGGLPMKTLVRWTAEAMHGAWSAGVGNFFWFSLNDEARDGSRPFNETLESGLYFRGATLDQDRPKPVLAAFRFPFVAYSAKGSRLSFWGRTPTSRPGRVKIQIQRGKKWRTIAVARAAKSGVFRGSVRTRYGADRRGAARAVFAGQRAPSFSMRPVKDFYHPPFGKPVG